MIAALLYLVIVALILGLIYWVTTQVPFLQPFAHIIRVICVVIFVIYCIYLLMGLAGLHMPTVLTK
jgi:hypothetical protein